MTVTKKSYLPSSHAFKNIIVIIQPELSKIMSERKMYPIKCADCGKDSEVPFEPKTDRPVYCRECLPKHRSGGPRS